MYLPAEHVVTAVARPVSAVTVHALVTYWLPLGAAHVATAHVALVPAVAPEAVYKLVPATALVQLAVGQVELVP
jgi:hypothetical protein